MLNGTQTLGEPCASCRKLLVRQSLVLDRIVKACAAAGDNEVLGRVLIRLAASGHCDEAEPFETELTRQPREDIAQDPAQPAPMSTAVLQQFVSAMLCR